MDLFELLGKVTIDNADANKALDQTSQQGEKTQSKLASAFGKVGKGAAVVGKTVMTGLAVGGTAMAGLTIKAVNLAGELEQNMGGSEQVFGQYAAKMQDTAKSAFSSMGLSTNDFLATANKMGALFQGAGFDIQESADLSANAMQRAADVASIMGIDTSSAMEAIAGAAKGNFTMMDNLGVAMNETALAAYALEKGYEKTYDQMSQQEKIGVAMEMFMDKTAYAAGNYAKENETLAGSLGTAKAALTNFLDGSGDVESLVNAFSNAANVIVKNVTKIAPRLVTGITEVIGKIIPMLPPLLQELLPAIINGAVSLINGLVQAMPMIVSTIMDALPALIDGIVQILDAVIAALPQMISTLVSALPRLLPQLIDGVIQLIISLCAALPQIIQPIMDNLPDIIISIVNALVQNLPLLIQGLIQMVIGIVTALPQIIQGLIQAIPTIIDALINGLVAAIPALIDGCIQLVLAIVAAIPQIIQALIDAIPTIVESVITGLLTAVPALIEGAIQLVMAIVQALPQILSSLAKALPEAFKAIWESVKIIFSNVGGWFGDRFKEGKENAQKAWSTAKNVFGKVWDGIKNTFSNVGGWFKDRFNEGKENAKNAWSNAKTIFSKVKNNVTNAFSNVGTWFKNTFSKAKDNSVNAWSNVKSNFSKIKDGVVNAFSNIKEKISKPFEKARDAVKSVADKIKGFFKGEISLPKIKMPHFSIKPSGWKIGDLLQGSIPKLGIDWYAKGGIMKEPTLFDYNPATGRAKVGGEAGDEAIAPISTLQQYVRSAVQGETALMAEQLERIINLLVQFFPDALAAMEQTMVLDTGVLVAETAPKMDTELGRIAIKKGRGR